MNKGWTWIILLLLTSNCFAQKIRTIVPKEPVVIGNAFQVQYIVTDPSQIINIDSPSFDSLRLISGPNYYKGSAMVDGQLQPIENITYTLVPSRLGQVRIHGISVNFKSGEQKSNDALVSVMPAPRVSFTATSSYTDVSLYAPSSKTDLDKLIHENLFITAEVDKKSCYIGEPIVATFKLYSCLQSTSEVVHTPVLYGFSVIDMLTINEVHQSVETINGKVYNTSILRKLQLYPEQAGKLVIDAMQLNNEIEFDDSLTPDRKTKIGRSFSSMPVTVTVKALPPARPVDFINAVGRFSLAAHIEPARFSTAQQGKLFITISGAGNFIQLDQPAVQWPKQLDVFEPAIEEQLDKTKTPAGGSRTYSFSFTADSTGHYDLPPISFSYFDLSSKTYQTVSSAPLAFDVINPEKKDEAPLEMNRTRSHALKWIVAGMVLIGLLFFIAYQSRKKPHGPPVDLPVAAKPDFTQQVKSLDIEKISDKQLCLEVQKICAGIAAGYDLSRQQKEELRSILDECQLTAYSDIHTEGKKEELIDRVLTLLQEIQ